MNATAQVWRFDEDKAPDPRAQRALAERRFLQMKAQTVAWLMEGTKKVKRPYMSGPAAETTVAIPDRVKEYVGADQKAQALEATKATMFGQKATPELKKARDEAAALRTELMADINDQTNQMKLGLRGILSPDQKRMNLPKETVAAAKPEWTRISKVDNSVRWGLAIIGGLLIVGLFTRVAAVAGAAFLLSFYLAMPAFPWLPEPAMSEGHYLFVNKNIIEMLALLTIAVSHPGRRYGFDIWIRMIWRAIRGQKAKPEGDRVIAVKVPAEVPSDRLSVGTPEPSTRSDSSHAS
jgi:uncharacterized membrane protein YphA (DoxX/SURF4 family)